MEDGRGRCPFNPEYKSTAIIVGEFAKPSMFSKGLFYFRCIILAVFSKLLICVNTFFCVCVAGGELYTATVSNFQGNEPSIYRSLGSGTPLKMENSLNWLQGKHAHIHTHALNHKGPHTRCISKNKRPYQ